MKTLTRSGLPTPTIDDERLHDQVARHGHVIAATSDQLKNIDTDNGYKLFKKRELKRDAAARAGRSVIDADEKELKGLARLKDAARNAGLKGAIDNARVSDGDSDLILQQIRGVTNDQFLAMRSQAEKVLGRTPTRGEAVLIDLAQHGVAGAVKVVQNGSDLFRHIAQIGPDAVEVARVELARAVSPEAMEKYDHLDAVESEFQGVQNMTLAIIGKKAGIEHLREVIKQQENR